MARATAPECSCNCQLCIKEICEGEILTFAEIGKDPKEIWIAQEVEGGSLVIIDAHGLPYTCEDFKANCLAKKGNIDTDIRIAPDAVFIFETLNI